MQVPSSPRELMPSAPLFSSDERHGNTPVESPPISRRKSSRQQSLDTTSNNHHNGVPASPVAEREETSPRLSRKPSLGSAYSTISSNLKYSRLSQSTLSAATKIKSLFGSNSPTAGISERFYDEREHGRNSEMLSCHPYINHRVLTRDSIQSLLFETADVLLKASKAFSNEQARHGNLLENDSDQMLSCRIHELAKRVEMGGEVNAEIDLETVALFLRVFAASPSLVRVSVPSEERRSVASVTAYNMTQEPEDIRHTTEIEDVISTCIVFDERKLDHCDAAFISRISTQHQHSSLTIKVNDYLGGYHYLSPSPNITCHEVKQETLRILGQQPLFDRHTLTSMTYPEILVEPNIPISRLVSNNTSLLEFNLRKCPPVRWNVVVKVEVTDTFRHVSVDSSMNIHDLKEIVKSMEQITQESSEFEIWSNNPSMKLTSSEYLDPWKIIGPLLFKALNSHTISSSVTSGGPESGIVHLFNDEGTISAAGHKNCLEKDEMARQGIMDEVTAGLEDLDAVIWKGRVKSNIPRRQRSSQTSTGAPSILSDTDRIHCVE
ncbi:hypothetical protein BCR33DRAFT_171374 [Rhizoclosmatium globosum]|uniref:Uncharacterized protein n=1 Tax=Rhizoclosmatium globosum TaxID=329046 RepID=A0A1Y2CFB4_9FUNG|nr:hypothetical protein BCR33DRAFT_171374 [Rhizoclosmatium globosum]|eukprot:ORY45616.1 hypothetical protein BCR33DRAFT_171374 [Rhizoclosmatium globosum]